MIALVTFSNSLIQLNTMTCPLTLLVLGQAYCIGRVFDPQVTPTGQVIETSNANIDPPRLQNVPRRSDYTYTSGVGAHKVHTTVTVWAKASKLCQNEGGHLAVINSQAEANVIARLFHNAGPHAHSYSPGDAWIGTHDLISQEGDYETIFGQSLAEAGYEEWHERRSSGSAHCGAVNRDGKLSWFHCARDLGFICELPYDQPYTPAHGACNGVIKPAAWWIRKRILKESIGNVATTESVCN